MKMEGRRRAIRHTMLKDGDAIRAVRRGHPDCDEGVEKPELICSASLVHRSSRVNCSVVVSGLTSALSGASLASVRCSALLGFFGHIYSAPGIVGWVPRCSFPRHGTPQSFVPRDVMTFLVP